MIKISVITCIVCEKTFRVKPSRAGKAKYCSQSCYHQSRKKKRVGCACKLCWAPFTVTENDYELGKGQFCSRQCRSTYRKAVGFHRNKVECDVCGNWFRCKPSYKKHGVKRCSVTCKAEAYLGEGHPRWSETGRRIETNGYVSIRTDSGEWVHEHRFVVEEILDRKLATEEEIHHINEDKADNRLDNLAILTKDDHRILHTMKNMQERYPDDEEFIKQTNKKIKELEEKGRAEIHKSIAHHT